MKTLFPPYSFVPGYWPHPTRDPRGHSYGVEPPGLQELKLDQWRSCAPYLEGIDLFNAGYYWEAHEAWEAVWKAVGRQGVEGELVQGLIQLAAVGIKIRQGYGDAAFNLLRRSLSNLRRVHEQRPEGCTAGLYLNELVPRWEQLLPVVKELEGNPTLAVEVVLEPLRVSEVE